jgi:hypothetical protein
MICWLVDYRDLYCMYLRNQNSSLSTKRAHVGATPHYNISSPVSVVCDGVGKLPMPNACWHRRLRRLCVCWKAVACSTSSIPRNTNSSWYGRPTICTPTGRPVLSRSYTTRNSINDWHVTATTTTTTTTISHYIPHQQYAFQSTRLLDEEWPSPHR